MIYDISHRTIFGYSQSVAISQHLLHLVPRNCPHQTCRHHALIVEPPPTVMREAVDFFGNSMTYLTVEESHDELAIVAKSVIEVAGPLTIQTGARHDHVVGRARRRHPSRP